MSLEELALRLSGDRGVADAVADAAGDTGWRALIDALIAREQAVEIDWRSEPDEVREGITRIGGRIEKKAWNRVVNLADDDSAAEILHGAAKAVGAGGKALVEIVRPTDTIVVVLVRRASLGKLQALAKAAGGALRDLAKERPAAKAARRISGPRQGTWRQAVLDLDCDATNTHGLLYEIVRHPGLIPTVEKDLSKAPAPDRALVGAVVALLRGRTPKTDAITYVRALGFVASAPKHTSRAFMLLAAAAKENATVAFRRQLVQAVRLPQQDELGRRAFAKLSAKDRAALRELVHTQLASRDSMAFHAAVGAARVVGDASTRTLLRALGAGQGYAAKQARAALAGLMKTASRE